MYVEHPQILKKLWETASVKIETCVVAAYILIKTLFGNGVYIDGDVFLHPSAFGRNTYEILRV
jgi:hypothetical protein